MCCTALRRSIGLSLIISLSIDASVGAPVSQATKDLSGSDVLPALLTLRNSTQAGLPPPYIVETGQVRTFDTGPVLATEELVLSPGSTLVLSAPAIGDRGREMYIVAKKITIRPGGGRAPVVTWNRSDPISIIPPLVGKAAAGTDGQAEGETGGRGADGAPGNPGFPGASAPTLYIAIDGVEAQDYAQIQVDLRGQDAGPGGVGQVGGNGGHGARGTSGSSSLVDCKRGGGNGGNGGDGGNGGPGGVGGRGGDGGTLVLLGAPEALGTLTSHLLAVNKDGTPGSGGRGGPGGEAGHPGEGGSPAPPYCGGGKPGTKGNSGHPGQDNSAVPGADGLYGSVLSVSLNQNNLVGIGLRVR